MAEIVWEWWAVWMVVIPVMVMSWFWGPSYVKAVKGSSFSFPQSDKEIYTDVLFRLLKKLRTEAADVHVHVRNGQVVLGGWVSSRPIKKKAERIAEKAQGVVDIQNQLKLKDIVVPKERVGEKVLSLPEQRKSA